MHAARVLATSIKECPKFLLTTDASNRGISNDRDAHEGSAACSEKAVQQDSYSNQNKMARLTSRAPVKIGGAVRPADEDRKVPPASKVNGFLMELTTPTEERTDDISAPQREPRTLYALVQLSRRFVGLNQDGESFPP